MTLFAATRAIPVNYRTSTVRWQHDLFLWRPYAIQWKVFQLRLPNGRERSVIAFVTAILIANGEN